MLPFPTNVQFSPSWDTQAAIDSPDQLNRSHTRNVTDTVAMKDIEPPGPARSMNSTAPFGRTSRMAVALFGARLSLTITPAFANVLVALSASTLATMDAARTERVWRN